MNHLSFLRTSFHLICLLLLQRACLGAPPVQVNQKSVINNGSRNASLAAGPDIGAKVNALVAACAGAPCPIYIPSGTYSFTTPIILTSNVDLSGAGQSQTILIYTALHPTAGSSATTGTITTAITAGSNTTKVKIHDLQILGTPETIGLAASYNNTQGIALKGTFSTIDKVKVAHHWAYASAVGISGSHNTLSNSDVEFGSFCVGLTGSYHTIHKNYISNHYSAASSAEKPAVHYWDGIASEGLSYSLIEGNTVEDNGQSGIYAGGNGGLSSHNKIVNNLVQRNWNRGIDNGVTGSVSKQNGVIFLTIAGNHVIDNLADNIWLVCVQQAEVNGNKTEYTNAYPTFFGANATNTRAGIVVADLCGTAPQDTSNNVSVTGNTVLDYQTASVLGLNFNVKPLSTGNKFASNTSNSRFYIGPNVALSKNSVQK